MNAMERTPDETRQAILWAAFEEMHEHGFQAASLSRILGRVGVTKGALYHHFGSKTELGYAVVDEVVGKWVLEQWKVSLDPEDPITAIGEMLRCAIDEAGPEGMRCGCPLNNLAQEMSPIDEGFRTRIAALFDRWRHGLAAALEAGQRAGTVREDVDPVKVAGFFVAAVEGGIGMAKSDRSLDLIRGNMEILLDYLETLRPATATV